MNEHKEQEKTQITDGIKVIVLSGDVKTDEEEIADLNKDIEKCRHSFFVNKNLKTVCRKEVENLNTLKIHKLHYIEEDQRQTKIKYLQTLEKFAKFENKYIKERLELYTECKEKLNKKLNEKSNKETVKLNFKL